MPPFKEESEVVHQFASACEQMNAYARRLREASRFKTIRTGADIRSYETGWRLEKWVEAELDKDEGLWAAWWLELGPNENGWLITSHLSIDPSALFISLEDRVISSASELAHNLSEVVGILTHALERNSDFAAEIERRYRLNQ